MLDKKYGYINCYGEEIIPIFYDELDRFNGEIAFFKWGHFSYQLSVISYQLSVPRCCCQS